VLENSQHINGVLFREVILSPNLLSRIFELLADRDIVIVQSSVRVLSNLVGTGDSLEISSLYDPF
jgi:hypothetical protein